MISRIINKIRVTARRIGGEEKFAERRRLARRYLKGTGLEVGALHQPLWVPRSVRIRYVDRLPVDELRRQYPELAALPLVNVDVIDDGETLRTIADGSQDFMVSNHFLEHTQDPIGTLKRHLAVLKPGGILYLAVPDKRLTFDRKRPNTSLEHLMKDHLEGPAVSYEEHINEYAALVDGHEGEALLARVRQLKETNYSIHFHVWTEDTFRAFLEHMTGPLAAPCQLLELVPNPKNEEIISILRRS